MKPKKIDFVGLVLVAAGVWLMFGGGLPSWVPGATKAGQATWVYEQRAGDPPGYVEAALSELNLRTPPVLAEQLDVDLPPPPRLVEVFAAAKAKGLPAFVTSTATGKVIEAIPGSDLKTKADVLGAVR